LIRFAGAENSLIPYAEQSALRARPGFGMVRAALAGGARAQPAHLRVLRFRKAVWAAQ
jgi:hypothetical protein